MTVIFSKRCELALQAVLYLSAGEPGKCFSAIEISNELSIPKEFTSKILQTLTSFGIVSSKKGKSGGFCIGKDPKEIRLIDIVEAIDTLNVFHNCVLGFPGCTVDEPCPVHNEWGKLREETVKMLSEKSLAELQEQTINKINFLKMQNAKKAEDNK